MNVSTDGPGLQPPGEEAGRSGALWEALFHSPYALFAHLDCELNFIRVNEAYAAADGRDPVFFPGKSHFDLYPDPGNEAIFRRVVATGDPVRFEARPFEYANHPERGTTHWNWSLVPLKDADGAVTGLLLSLVDVTENIRALEALTDRERRFRHLVESVHAIPWEADPETLQFTYVGPQGAATLGYPLEAWLQPHFWEHHLHPEDRPWAPAFCREMGAKGEDHDFEYRMIAADGRLVWIRDTVRVVMEKSGPRCLQGFMFDVTERRRAEEALRKSEEKYRDIFNNVQVGLWRTRLHDGKILECNDRLATMFGYADRADAIANMVAPEHYLDPAERGRMAALVKATGELAQFEARMRRRDGRSIWVRFSARRQPGADYLDGVVADITEERRAIERLKASESELSRILETMQDTYYRTDPEARFVRVSGSIAVLLGYRPEEVIGRSVLDFYANPGDRDRFLAALAANGGAVQDYGLAMKHRDGSVVWLSLNAHHYRDEAGNAAGVEGTCRDVTDRRRAEAWTRKLSGALEQTADTVMITDRQGVIEYVNPAFERVTGYARAEVIGAKPNLLNSGRQGLAFHERLWVTILAGQTFQDVFVNRKRDGSLYYEEKTITPLKDQDGAVSHFVATGKDISERMQAQERLQYLAHHDVLSELPNRALFADRLEHALARSRDRDRAVAVLFIDLDRFKIVNDTLGHDVGDRALQALAQRLRTCVRQGDTVARLGGDEFAVILEDIADSKNVISVARKIREAFSMPVDLNGRELVITASIGVSVSNTDGDDPRSLLRHADIAMYRAKEQGGNGYRFYASDMSARAFERLSIETSLRHALGRQEFVLHYQPQVEAASGKVVGVEALLRWLHPELGLVSPDRFIPILEETGLILPVGEWALAAACRQAGAWRAQGHPLRLALNLSTRQFHAPGLAHTVSRTLTETGTDPRDVELEITEGVLVQQSQETADTFRALSDMDLRLAIDDFGTGYSSLIYLKRFAINTLKIDRAFMLDVEEDQESAAIVQAIIAMAHRLGLQVIAEGVETPAQLEFLRAQGCDLVQGHLFSQPVPAEQIAPLLRTGYGQLTG